MLLRRHIPLLLGLLLLMAFLVWISQLNRMGPPVQYPPGWPLAWLHVPPGSRAALLPLSADFGEPSLAEVRPWTALDDGSGNTARSWHVGFAFSGTEAEAVAALDRQLRGRGWSKLGSEGLTSYFSADRHREIRLLHLSGRHTLAGSRPDSWELSIIEYRDTLQDEPGPLQPQRLD